MALAHENEVANLKAVAEGEKAQKALEEANAVLIQQKLDLTALIFGRLKKHLCLIRLHGEVFSVPHAHSTQANLGW